MTANLLPSTLNHRVKVNTGNGIEILHTGILLLFQTFTNFLFSSFLYFKVWWILIIDFIDFNFTPSLFFSIVVFLLLILCNSFLFFILISNCLALNFTLSSPEQISKKNYISILTGFLFNQFHSSFLHSPFFIFPIKHQENECGSGDKILAFIF